MGSHAIAKQDFLFPLPFLSTCTSCSVCFYENDCCLKCLFNFCVFCLVLVRCSLFFSFCEFQVHYCTSFSAL